MENLGELSFSVAKSAEILVVNFTGQALGVNFVSEMCDTLPYPQWVLVGCAGHDLRKTAVSIILCPV